MDSKQKVVLIPAIASAAIIIFGIILGDAPILGNLIIISIFITIVPYFLYRYSKFMWLKAVEDQFPNFVRDLADSTRSGMSLPESIAIVSKSNYGKLSQEIQKMNNRLSWDTPFTRTLEIFRKNVKGSKVICEALGIIRQSYESGGSIPSTLDAVARDMIMLKEAEAERSSLVKQQVMMMYGLFFIFLGISVMIIYVMVPMLISQSAMSGQGSAGGISSATGVFTFANPCDESGLVFPCAAFSGICSVLGITKSITCYYVAIFFYLVIIQGIFTGLIAGQLSENSAVSGVKHSLIMVFSALAIFLFFAKAGMFPT